MRGEVTVRRNWRAEVSTAEALKSSGVGLVYRQLECSGSACYYPQTTLSHASHACTFKLSLMRGVTVFDGPGPRFVLAREMSMRAECTRVLGGGGPTEGHSDGPGGPVPGETKAACLESGSEGRWWWFGGGHDAEHMMGVSKCLTVRCRSAPVNLA